MRSPPNVHLLCKLNYPVKIALCSFAIYKKRDPEQFSLFEQFTLLLFRKRETLSDALFAKRVTESDLLFHSF